MFVTRLISGVVVLGLAVAAMLLGGNILFGFVVLITLIGLTEFYKATHIHGLGVAMAGYGGAVLYEALLWMAVENGELMAMAIGVLLIMTVYVLTFPKYKAEQTFAAIAGMVYVTVLMSFIYQVRMLEQGLFIIPLIFICAWGNDTCAYCVGMLIERHKMSPKLSTKKRIEGFV